MIEELPNETDPYKAISETIRCLEHLIRRNPEILNLIALYVSVFGPKTAAERLLIICKKFNKICELEKLEFNLPLGTAQAESNMPLLTQYLNGLVGQF